MTAPEGDATAAARACEMAGYDQDGARLLVLLLMRMNAAETAKQRSIFVTSATKRGHAEADALEAFSALERYARAVIWKEVGTW